MPNNKYNNPIITSSNCITFNTNSFTLANFCEELSSFYSKKLLGDYLEYAHVFNKFGLLSAPFPINGNQTLKFNCEYLEPDFIFSDEDKEYAFNLTMNIAKNDFISKYKYNIIYLYGKIIRSYADMICLEDIDSIFLNSMALHSKEEVDQEVEFHLFINNNPITMPEFEIIQNKFL
jgi:hypothetical protein